MSSDLESRQVELLRVLVREYYAGYGTFVAAREPNGPWRLLVRGSSGSRNATAELDDTDLRDLETEGCIYLEQRNKFTYAGSVTPKGRKIAKASPAWGGPERDPANGEPVNVARGKSVIEPSVHNPRKATDGVTTGYTPSFGFAWFTWPGTLTVDLGTQHNLRCIRFLLWDGRGLNADGPIADRRYHYCLATSPNKKVWDTLFETPEGGAIGWQVLHVDPSNEWIRARYVRIVGLRNTANAHFHVVQLEAYEGDPAPLPAELTSLEADIQVPIRAPSSKAVANARARTRSTLRPLRGQQLQPGTVLDCYRLQQRLGHGFSATVWKAQVVTAPAGIRLKKGASVAVKVYNPNILSSHESIRIQREFTVASELQHASLVRVHDVVISPSRPWHTFLVMELVEGTPLKQHLTNSGAQSMSTILSIGRQLFDGIDALHSQGALHRDVKAANVMLVNIDEARVKLLDFGIVALESERQLTAHSVFLGSKHSAPLEQLKGERLDARADIYSIGTVLFHCYEGRPPYEDAGPEGAIVARMLTKPELLLPRRPEDAQLVDFINRCMAVDRLHRPASAASARLELDRMS